MMLMIIILFAHNINADHAERPVQIRSRPALRAPQPAMFTPINRSISRTELYRQEPDPVGATGVACQLDSVYPFEADFADDIEPTGGDWAIDSITSWWQNWSFTSWYAVPYINFIVYADSGMDPPQPVDSPFVEVMVEQSAYSATSVGAYQWIVEMKLPEEITLEGGQRYWIEIQPANVFTGNGQTGWMCNVGIGNGQEGYSRFPLLGYDVWTASSVVHEQAFEAGFVLYGTQSGGAEVDWDFEDGTMQGWTHTNGQAYPAGWDVIDTGTANWPPPDMGNYCLGIDDDAAGSGVSVIDTVKSPVFSSDYFHEWLHWAIGYNSVGGDWVDVVIAYYEYGSWNHDLVRHYTTDQGGYSYGVWDSVDVSGYTADQCQIMFIFNDGGAWAWWCEIDNIGPVVYVPTEHDVGALAFLSPGTQVSPADYDVIGVTKNYGDFEETYDVHCVVTDPTFATVLDETVNVTTPAGENDTINFGTITFVDGYTYDLMMVTLLAGDENPANDTTTQATLVSSTGWEIWPNLPEGRSGPYAGFWNIDGQSYVYCFGGNPGPLPTAIKYDGTGWNSIPDMPVASLYGGDASVDGKVYLIGAWTGQNGLLTIFDCENETYSSINLPIPVADPAIAAYQDNYIYSIGGSNPPGWSGSTIVQLYDIVGDSFFSAVAQLPAARYVTAAEAGYIGNDTLIVAGGYDAAATNKVTFGAIDPGNPANVTWTAATPFPGVPVYRCYGDAVCNDAGDYMFILAGGSPYTSQTLGYRSNIGWFMLELKPTPSSNCGAVAGPWETLADEAPVYLYTVGGYTGSYLNTFEVYRTGWYTGIQERIDDHVTVFDFSLKTANPVTGQARFTLSLPVQGSVHFQVFDITGRQVLDSYYSSISQGEHTLFWDLRDDRGREVPAGPYLYRLEAGEYSATGKIVVVK